MAPPDPLFRFKLDMGHLHALCFLDHTPNAQETFLLAAGEDGIVFFLDLESCRLKYKQKLGESIQAIHTYNEMIIIQEKAGLVTICIPGNKQPTIYKKQLTIPCVAGFCKSIKHQETLLIPQETGCVDCYDLREMTRSRLIQIKNCLHDDLKLERLGQMMCIEAGTIENNMVVFVAFESGDVFLHDLNSDSLISHVKFNECIITLTYDSKKAQGVIGGAHDELQVFTVDATTSRIKPACNVQLSVDGCQVVKIRRDGKILVAGGCDGRTRIYSWRSLRLLATLVENHACVTDVQFSETVKTTIMAVCGADGVITIWKIY